METPGIQGITEAAMTQEPPHREALRTQYDGIHRKYEKLEESLRRDLNTFFDEAGISVLSIESRVKEFGSFWRNVQRKRCHNPLEDIQDICGLRVICYYPSDLEPVSEVVKGSFEVIEFEDKADSLRTGEFGYRSRHFVVTPKEHALRTASYQGLDELKAEIQVRTIFEHAWAELSHELEYKKEEHAPKELRRRLHQLGAMLENLDAQFDELHTAKVEYRRSVSEEAREIGRFDVSQDLNIDTLKAFLDFHFPESPPDERLTRRLLDDLLYRDGTLGTLQAAYERIGGYEELIRLASSGPIPRDEWTQPVLADFVLDLGDDEWWRARSRVGRLGPYRQWVAEAR